MAFTLSTLVQGVAFGNQLVKAIRVTADATTGIVNTGMTNLNFVEVTAVSAVTNPIIMLNTSASGVAAAGTVGMSATANGAVYMMVAYGY